jgi:hypothetical protein
MNLNSQYEFYIFLLFLIKVYCILLLDQAFPQHIILLWDNLLLNQEDWLHTHLYFLLFICPPITFSLHRNNQKSIPYTA